MTAAGGGRMPRAALVFGATLAGLLVAALLVWRLGPTAAILPAALAFCAFGVRLSVIDVVEHRLPNRLVLPAFGVVFALLLVAASLRQAQDGAGPWAALGGAATGAAGMFALYLAMALISPRGMGMGDVKLGAVIGLLLGFGGWELWVAGLALAFLVGGAAALLALATRRARLSSAIPFGPSMIGGALLAVLLFG